MNEVVQIPAPNLPHEGADWPLMEEGRKMFQACTNALSSVLEDSIH